MIVIMRVQIIGWLMAGLAVVSPVLGEPRKLFPQISEGIVNSEGQTAMDCRVADDGLTVTDLAWQAYAPGEGFGKRWNFNQTPFTDRPLINYRFDDSLAGLQVSIVIEIFNRTKPWEVVETYQEIIQLGGERQLELPQWFHVPQDRLAYDFDEGTWFPSGWSLPKGKFACWEGAGKYKQVDRHGKHPMFDFGFTHVADNTFSAGGQIPAWDQQCRVFGDAEWLDMSDGGNFNKWHNDAWKARGSRMQIVLPDFENADHWRWNGDQYAKFAELVADFRKDRPDCYIGCWGMGVSAHSYRIFDGRDANGQPTGVVDEAAAAWWKRQYDHPESAINPIFDRGGLNFGNPCVYWSNGTKPSHLYAVVQEWEVAKLARPDIPNVISTWIQSEFLDGYPLSSYRFQLPDGTPVVRRDKHQAPPTIVYALSLFAHARMDGAYCWEVGNRYSEDLADVGPTDVRLTDIFTQGVPRTFNGQTQSVLYYVKYFGFYNYHVLGMWQAARNKDIIEADTPWIMPELWTSTHQTWRTGDQRYPSYVNLNREPLVRIKPAADGKSLLVLACNPYNTARQTVKARLPGSNLEVRFELAADYPILRRFDPGNGLEGAETPPDAPNSTLNSQGDTMSGVFPN